jgi:hypothetical protein
MAPEPPGGVVSASDLCRWYSRRGGRGKLADSGRNRVGLNLHLCDVTRTSQSALSPFRDFRECAADRAAGAFCVQAGLFPQHAPPLAAARPYRSTPESLPPPGCFDRALSGKSNPAMEFHVVRPSAAVRFRQACVGVAAKLDL